MKVNLDWAVRQIATSPLFDEGWYLETYRIPQHEDAAEHYLMKGYKKGWNPSKFFLQRNITCKIQMCAGGGQIRFCILK